MIAKTLDYICDAAALATLIFVATIAYCVFCPPDYPMHVSAIQVPSFGKMTATRKHEARIQEVR